MTTTTVLAYIPSPPQGVWHLGPFPIRAYALFIIVGIIVGCWWGSRRWLARGGQEGEVLDVAIWAVPFGLIGGRIYHVLTDWSTYFGADAVKAPIDALKIWEGGLGIWGAVAFGALGAWIGCRRHGIKLGPFGDAIAPAILLAQAIGRIGNYFNQELFGGTTTLPWGLKIYDRENSFGQIGPNVIDGVSTGHVSNGLMPAVHPTFLYELLWNVLVVLILVALDRYLRIGHGRLFALYVAGYCLGRFGIELMRTDHATEILGIRINVFTAVIVFACAAAYFVLAPKGRELGLTMYQPWRAEELESEGVIGYVDPFDDDDDDASDSSGGSDDSRSSSSSDELASRSVSRRRNPTSKTATATDDVDRIVSVTRDIAAPASTIFELIADPAQQPRWDGNDNLAEAVEGQRVHKVGDTFDTTITRGAVRRNHIVEFEENELIAWLPSEVDASPPGHLWRWELTALDDDNTRVTHTYNWTRLSDPKRLEKARSTTPDKLQASLDRLAELAEQVDEAAVEARVAVSEAETAQADSELVETDEVETGEAATAVETAQETAAADTAVVDSAAAEPETMAADQSASGPAEPEPAESEGDSEEAPVEVAEPDNAEPVSTDGGVDAESSSADEAPAATPNVTPNIVKRSEPAVKKSQPKPDESDDAK